MRLLIEYCPVCALTILRLASCLLLSLVFAWATPTLAATISVDSGSDNTTGGDGACTLREAINNSNGDSDTTGGDCVAGATGSDIIEISTNVSTITIDSVLEFSLSPVTINGNGVTIDGNALRTTSGLIVVHGNSSLSLNNATLEGGGHDGTGVLHLAGSLSLSNVTIRNFYRSAISVDPGSSITIALTNVLLEDGSGTYTSYVARGLAMAIGNHSTITVNNLVLRRLYGGNAAFSVRPDADARTIITLTGCLTTEAVYPQLTSGNVVNNSTGDCAGTIGNGDSAAREEATPVASSCGLPLDGVLVADATYNLVADCQMTGKLYLPKGVTVTINGNGHTITAANGERILNGAGKLTVNNVVFTGAGSGGPVLLILQSDSIFRQVAFRDNQGPVLVADQNVEFDRVIFEMNTTTLTFGSAASALRHLLSGTVTVRNSIFRNNSGGVAAVYSGVSSGIGDPPRLTLEESVVFEGNSPQDRADESSNFIDNRVVGAILPEVGPFRTASPQTGPTTCGGKRHSAKGTACTDLSSARARNHRHGLDRQYAVSAYRRPRRRKVRSNRSRHHRRRRCLELGGKRHRSVLSCQRHRGGVPGCRTCAADCGVAAVGAPKRIQLCQDTSPRLRCPAAVAAAGSVAVRRESHVNAAST